MVFIKRWIFLTILSLLVGASPRAQGYDSVIRAWDLQRVAELKAPGGWLNLAGLYWLEPGKNSFGSGDKVKIKFPAVSLPPEAGYFERTGDSVIQFSAPGVAIRVGGVIKTKALLFSDPRSTAPESSFGSFRWTLIKRGDRIGIRLRDLNSPALAAFKGIDRYPVDSSWCLTARLERPARTAISITNVLGQTSKQASPGQLVFSYHQQQYSLDALEEDGELFIVFGDSSSGEGSYPAGRFLKAPMPGNDGYTFLDFNKAYNPPCAFTPFATCPLPPRKNILPFAVRAGEKFEGKH